MAGGNRQRKGAKKLEEAATQNQQNCDRSSETA
jgi:hypothetical protein